MFHLKRRKNKVVRALLDRCATERGVGVRSDHDHVSRNIHFLDAVNDSDPGAVRERRCRENHLFLRHFVPPPGIWQVLPQSRWVFAFARVQRSTLWDRLRPYNSLHYVSWLYAKLLCPGSPVARSFLSGARGRRVLTPAGNQSDL